MASVHHAVGHRRSIQEIPGGDFTQGILHILRARRMQRFLSQPFHVAEKFSGVPGRYVPREETIRGFREILDGKHDDLPESAFLFAGTIDEVVEKAKKGA